MKKIKMKVEEGWVNDGGTDSRYIAVLKIIMIRKGYEVMNILFYFFVL